MHKRIFRPHFAFSTCCTVLSSHGDDSWIWYEALFLLSMKSQEQTSYGFSWFNCFQSLQKEHVRAFGVLQTKKDARMPCDCLRNLWQTVGGVIQSAPGTPPEMSMLRFSGGGDVDAVARLWWWYVQRWIPRKSWWWRRWWWWLLKRNSTWIFSSKDSSLQLPGSNARVRENRMNSGGCLLQESRSPGPEVWSLGPAFMWMR